MALRPTSREIELALVAATCGTALVLAFAALSPAFGQTPTRSSGLRGLSAPNPALAGPPDAAPLGAQLRSSNATAPDTVGGLVSPPPPPADYSAGAGEPAPGAAINYGKPRKLAKQPLPNPPLKTPKKPLPALEPYKTSSIAKTQMRLRLRTKTVDPNARPDQPPPGVAGVPTIVVKARKLEEDKPFEPTGISLGSLRLKPYVEGSGGYDTNPMRAQTVLRGYPMLRGDAGATVESQWSQHSLKGEMRAGYSDFPGKSRANRPDGMGKLDGRVDVLRDTTIDFGGNFSIATLRPGSPELTWGSNNSISTNQPITWSAGGYAGVTHRFNRLQASLRGTLERSQTGDATFSDGTTQKLSLNDYTTVGAKPRLSYEVTPGLKPFVEATIDRRIYDETYDVNGYMRTSNGVTVRGGASFEVTRQLVGEVSGGYGQRNYEDPRLIPLRGPVVDGALIWTATPLTKVTLRGTTNLNETTIPGASGSISRKISGEIAHALLRNVTITGAAGYQVTNYQGASYQGVGVGGTNVTSINEQLLTAGVKVEYSLTRTVVVKASYAFENLKTTVQGANYTANIFLLGLRLQR